MKQRQSFTFDKELLDKLKEISAKSGIPQSRIVSDGVEKRIEKIKELLKK